MCVTMALNNKRRGGLLVLNNLFQASYFVGLIMGSIIRQWYFLKYKQDRKAIFREEGFIVGLLASFWGIAILLPLLYMFTPWLNFADIELPFWAGWIGILTFAVGLFLLWRSHADLGQNWRVTTEIEEGHTLVTNGVFKYIRHPMYSAHWLWSIAQFLLIHNWIAGLASLIIFIPMYFMRVRREEQMMISKFGEEYLSYIGRTGRIIPRILR